MESAKKLIQQENLIKKGEKIAVATSGGIDSMTLLHFLDSIKNESGIEVVAVNVDHMIRKNSQDDSKFVADYCKKNGITCYKFKVDVLKLAENKKLGTEEAARVARYKIFDNVISKGLANKIAIAHHEEDQVETILLNIFRGAGLKGASGIEAKQENYIRPFLNTKKIEILQYAEENNIPHVEDQTNKDINYSRNFLRNKIMPELRERWNNIDNNILNFSKICKQDDEYINQNINYDDILIDNHSARIPLYKFISPDSIQNRILRYAFQKLGLSKDIEKRHLNILKSLIKEGKNGSKISLPNKLKASLDYDELVLFLPENRTNFVPKDFKTGKTNFENISITIKKTNQYSLTTPNCHVIDTDKLPKNAKWRTRKKGDVFAKFGSGEKKLKDYMIDKKIPNLSRDKITVLDTEKEVYCVLGYEISEKVKVTESTKNVYLISYQYKK